MTTIMTTIMATMAITITTIITDLTPEMGEIVLTITIAPTTKNITIKSKSEEQGVKM